ncbi:MAG: DUF1501 domain-containing protein, partial [Pseudomonadota bacterium]
MTMNRRNFLQQSSACALTGLGLTSLTSALPRMGAQAADVSGYKAIVCVFLFGGMDHHDTILPYDQPSYDQFADIRQDLMSAYAGQPGGSPRARDRLLPLNPQNAADFGGRQFALPGEMPELHALFEGGNAAITANVGPLITAVTPAEVEADSPNLPERLFSHNDQQSTWMALGPEGSGVGWGGRFADFAIESFANASDAFTAITTQGGSLFLSGERAVPFPVTDEGGAGFFILDILDDFRFTTEGENLYQATRDHIQSA